MANDYTSSTDAFADMSEGNYSSSDYPQMATFVTVASRLIDAEMGQAAGFFYPTTDSVTYYYDGNSDYAIDIDPFVSISAVGVSESGGVESTDYTALSSSDYFVEPYNYAAKAKPITRLRIGNLNGSANIPVFFSYRKAVSVTGIAGYSATVPDTIAQAARIQAVRWFMRGKQGYQDTGASVDIGGITVKGELQLDPDVKALLFPFKLELM